MPVVDRQMALLDMKQHVCAIVQCCTADGNPIDDPLCYALLFNELPCTNWIVTGEPNDDGIFHTHVLFRTSTRTDSMARSMRTAWERLILSSQMFIQRFTAQSTVDCMKIQKAHKPRSMLQYMMKHPNWVISNSDQLLQLAYDIDEWNLNDRFKNPQIETSADINAITKDLIGIITKGSCKSFEQMLRTDPLTMSQYLHRPGLKAIVENCLTFVKSMALTWNIKQTESHDPNPANIHKVLLFQGIMPCDFDIDFFHWITKWHSKKNTFVLQGPSNSGKSAFIKGLKEYLPWGEIINGQTFNFEQLVDVTIGYWEEPLIAAELAEKCKQIFEGMNTAISVKYKKPTILPRTPIFMTTNHAPWRFCAAEQEMFMNRMFIYFFNHTVSNESYICRSSEPSCKCCYCRASRGSPRTDGSTESSRMQRDEQSLSPGQQSIWTNESSNVWSRSMSSPGEGTSRSFRGSETISTIEQCSNSRSDSSSTSSTIERHDNIRYIGSNDSDNRICRSESNTFQHVESRQHIRHDGSDSNSDGNRQFRKHSTKRIRRGDGNYRREFDSTNSLGLLGKTTSQTQEISLPTKKQRMDRAMESMITTNEMLVPSQQDWLHYLSYLSHRYG